MCFTPPCLDIVSCDLEAASHQVPTSKEAEHFRSVWVAVTAQLSFQATRGGGWGSVGAVLGDSVQTPGKGLISAPVESFVQAKCIGRAWGQNCGRA